MGRAKDMGEKTSAPLEKSSGKLAWLATGGLVVLATVAIASYSTSDEAQANRSGRSPRTISIAWRSCSGWA